MTDFETLFSLTNSKHDQMNWYLLIISKQAHVCRKVYICFLDVKNNC